MKRFILSIAAAAAALGASASANAQALEGKWSNPKRSVIVNVERCGEAYCGTVSWASDKNKAKVSENGRKLIGTRILSDLRPAGNGLYSDATAEPGMRYTYCVSAFAAEGASTAPACDAGDRCGPEGVARGPRHYEHPRGDDRLRRRAGLPAPRGPRGVPRALPGRRPGPSHRPSRRGANRR